VETLAELMTSLGLWSFVNDYDWVWPVGEILHFIGMALLIGTVGLLDMRILGLGKGIPIASLEKLIPWGIAGFAMNAITGFIFVAGNPIGGPLVYLENLAFLIKLALILIAGINLLIYYVAGISHAAVASGPADDAQTAAKAVAVTSLVLWFGVIIFGRLIMYNDTLLYALGL